MGRGVIVLDAVCGRLRVKIAGPNIERIFSHRKKDPDRKTSKRDDFVKIADLCGDFFQQGSYLRSGQCVSFAFRQSMYRKDSPDTAKNNSG